MRRLVISVLVGPLFLFTTTFVEAGLFSSDLPVDSRLRPRVEFWKKVYTEISSKEGYLHDSDNPNLIYVKLDHSGKSRRSRLRYVRAKKRELKRTLLGISKKKKENLNEKEQELLSLVKDYSPEEIRNLAYNFRYQRGMSDRYLEGLERSYLYLDKIKKVLNEHDVPERLAFLPHVESSFNYKAYSKVGAAGIWQFMRSTARIYKVKLNYAVDERRDPLVSTRAAARLLRDNYRRLESWPLAITAYNHGPVSIERAVRQVGSRDISDIIENYQGRRFGFASKNFYASFMAAVELAENADEIFKDLKKMEPESHSEIVLNRPLTIRQISKATGVSRSTIREYNLALRPLVFRTNLYIPKGYTLRLPVMETETLAAHERSLASIKGGPSEISLAGVHIVTRGETLYELARVYRVSMTDIIVLNQITNPRRVLPGTRLKIPKKGGVKVAAFTQQKRKKDVVDRIQFASAKGKSPSDDQKSGKWLESFKKNVLAGFFAEKKEDNAIDFDHWEPKELSAGLYKITVEPDETISQLADWSGSGLLSLRRLNNLWGRRTIRLGQTLKIRMAPEQIENFKKQRTAFHLANWKDFFANYKLTGTKEYIVKRGDTYATLTRELRVPLWLIRRYQPANAKLYAGQRIMIPEVEAIR